MVLKRGTIIPFQYQYTKKLLVLDRTDKSGSLTICDVKNIVRSAFSIQSFEFYNKKIGFLIPDELLLPYLNQRHDFTNFVIEIVSTNDVSSCQEDETENAKEEAGDGDITLSSEGDPVETKSEHNPADSQLEEILQTFEGKTLWNDFQSSNQLTDRDRIMLCKLIITDEMKKFLRAISPLAIDTPRYLDLANAIVRKFPGEDANIYYTPLSSQQPTSGKLYEYFLVMKSRYLAKKGHSRYSCFESLVVESDFQELDELLGFVGDWSVYFDAWQKFYDLRRVYVWNTSKPLQYYEKFIAKVENYSSLVQYDFEKLHPKKGDKLLENWDQAIDRIFTEGILSCRDDVPVILDLYEDDPHLSAFMVFSYILQNDEKPFEKDDPCNLVVHIEKNDENTLEQFKEYCRSHNQLEPMVFATGQDVKELSFYVIVGDSLYCMDTVLKAVDFCFKCYQVLELTYPERQSMAWRVIQTVMYDIHTEDDLQICAKFLKIFNGF